MTISPKATWVLLAITLWIAAPRAQGYEEAQIEAAKATDTRFLNFVAKFRELVVKAWGPESKIGRLDATESRILANIHVGEEIHPVQLTPRRFKESKKFQLAEPEGTEAHLQDLSCLDEPRLRRLVELAHALPGGSKAHLFRIEIAYYPKSVDRFAAAIELIGVSERVNAAFDMATGDPIALGPALESPAIEETTPPIARRPRGGLREWLAAWDEVTSALEKTAGAPLPALSLEFSATGATAELLVGESPVYYRFNNQGLSKTDPPGPSTQACQKPFDPRQVKLNLLGELADRAFAAVDIPYRNLVNARVTRGPSCGAPEIRFILRNSNSVAEVTFNAEGEEIGSELR